MEFSHLDDPSRGSDINRMIKAKPALRKLYAEFYGHFSRLLQNTPAKGLALELGSGAGFLKEQVKEVITSDILPYQGTDLVFDGTRMCFQDGVLKGVFMMNVLHHIPDAEAFFSELDRCLAPGGRVLIVDEFPGWVGYPVYRLIHHEAFNPKAAEWRFQTSGPLSGANGALAWMIFKRDRRLFEEKFPRLKIRTFRPHTPFRYWLAGGLKKWSLLPGWAFGPATWLENILSKIFPGMASFVDIELERVEV